MPEKVKSTENKTKESSVKSPRVKKVKADSVLASKSSEVSVDKTLETSKAPKKVIKKKSSKSLPNVESGIFYDVNLFGKGKRKSACSVCFASLSTKGSGVFNVTVNSMPYLEYFSTESMYKGIDSVLFKFFELYNFDISCVITVFGSGKSSQADAVKLSIAKALSKFSPEIRLSYRSLGLLTTDARKPEGKKYGKKKSRKSEQFSKR